MEYLVYLNQNTNFFNESPDLNKITYTFGFQPINDHSGNCHDHRIEHTLISVFKNLFVENPSGIITYICDASDGQELVRLRLFTIWYNKHLAEDCDKLEVKIKDEDSYFCGAIIFLKENPFRDYINASFFKEFYGE